MTDALKGRIAVIGWGSLIWDLDNLAPFVTGDWMMGAGPSLPFEFTRVSPKRKMGLAVCLDYTNGDPCPTNAILSIRDDIDEAAEELRARERAKVIDYIGMIHPASGARRSSIPEVADIFADWCRRTGAAGAVWTDLGSARNRLLEDPERRKSDRSCPLHRVRPGCNQHPATSGAGQR